jgi:hypothetical protein
MQSYHFVVVVAAADVSAEMVENMQVRYRPDADESGVVWELTLLLRPMLMLVTMVVLALHPMHYFCHQCYCCC